MQRKNKDKGFMAKKENKISELVLQHNLLKERFVLYQRLQEQNRRDFKNFESLKKYGMHNYVRFLSQNIFEKKILLNALQKQCLEVKKKIRELNKEQVIKNKQNNKENGK